MLFEAEKLRMRPAPSATKRTLHRTEWFRGHGFAGDSVKKELEFSVWLTKNGFLECFGDSHLVFLAVVELVTDYRQNATDDFSSLDGERARLASELTYQGVENFLLVQLPADQALEFLIGARPIGWLDFVGRVGRDPETDCSNSFQKAVGSLEVMACCPVIEEQKHASQSTEEPEYFQVRALCSEFGNWRTVPPDTVDVLPAVTFMLFLILPSGMPDHDELDRSVGEPHRWHAYIQFVAFASPDSLDSRVMKSFEHWKVEGKVILEQDGGCTDDSLDCVGNETF